MTIVEQIIEKTDSLYGSHLGERPYDCYGALDPNRGSSLSPRLEFQVETPLGQTDVWYYDLENEIWKITEEKILVCSDGPILTKMRPKSVADYFFNREKYKERGVRFKVPFDGDYFNFDSFSEVMFSPVLRLLWYLGRTKEEIDDDGFWGEMSCWEFYLFYVSLTRSRRDLEFLKKEGWCPWSITQNLDYPTFLNFRKFYWDFYKKLAKNKEDRSKGLFSDHLWRIYRGMRGDLVGGLPMGGRRLRLHTAESVQEACEYIYNIYCKNGLTDEQATSIRKEGGVVIHPLWGTW